MDDPSTGEDLQAVHTAAVSQMRAAAAAAREAIRMGRWPRTPGAYRAASVRSSLAQLEAGSSASVEREVSELGTPIRAARARFTDTLDLLSARLPNLPELDPRVTVVAGDGWSTFADWASVTLSTLAAGGAVLLAPRPRVRTYATSLVEAADAADMLPGLLALLPTEDPTELASSPLVDEVVWLGRRADSTPLALATAQQVGVFRVEDATTAVVADATADPHEVARSLSSSFAHDASPSTPRVGFVHESIVEAVGKHLSDEAVVSRVGRADDAATHVGPVADEETLAAALAYIGIATKDRGAVLCGGTRIGGEGLPERGRYLAPTVMITRGEPDAFRAPLVTLCVRDQASELLEALEPFKPTQVRVFGEIDPTEVRIVTGATPLQVSP